MTDTEREFKVTVGRQHPITIEPINIVAAEAPGQAIRLKPTLYGEIHIECLLCGKKMYIEMFYGYILDCVCANRYLAWNRWERRYSITPRERAFNIMAARRSEWNTASMVAAIEMGASHRASEPPSVVVDAAMWAVSDSAPEQEIFRIINDGSDIPW